MSSEFKISVVLPTYDRRHTIGRALQSIYNQSFAAFQVIVVDDGSDDGTEAYVKSQFNEVEYLYQKNAGVSSARNRGIAAALGNWVAFLDSDDQWLPNKLFAQVEALTANPSYRFCHTDEIWVRNGKRVNAMKKHAKSGGHIFQKCLSMCVISPSSVLIHREVFSDVGLFDETLPACEDYDYWLRYCINEPVLYIDKPLVVKYGGHEDQLSRRHWGMDRFRIQALEKLIDSGVLAKAEHQAVLEVMATKCDILNKGAKKYGNMELIDYCQRIQAERLFQVE